MRVFWADARGAVGWVEGFGDRAVDWWCWVVRECWNLGGSGGEREGRGEYEPKGRWIWTPLTRGFLGKNAMDRM